MKLKVEVLGKRKAKEELRKLAKRAGLVNEKFVDYAAGVAQKTVVRNVQPFGLTGKARQQGEKAVWRSLHNAFKVVPNSYNGNDLVTGISEVYQYHQAARNSRGRVGSKRANRPKVRYDIFQRYGQQVIAKVGQAKGGFAAGQDKLKVPLQKWIKDKKHKGNANRRKGLRGVSWKFDNNQGYVAKGYVMGERGLRRVIRVHERVLRRSLQGRLRRLGKTV